MITLMVIVMITFVVLIVVVMMIFFVMHLSDKTVALYLIETKPDIQRGKAHVI
jgi:flagellar basal body-associated protein FliL